MNDGGWPGAACHELPRSRDLSNRAVYWTIMVQVALVIGLGLVLS